MKYELEPDNRNCPEEVLLDDLRAVASQLGGGSITKDAYDKHGRFCASTMQKRFGSWNTALQRSGLVIQKRVDIPPDELLNDLRRVSRELGMSVVSQEAYRELGGFSLPTFTRAFGSWVSALNVAGLEVSAQWYPKSDEDDLFSNMAKVWEAIGRQPRQKDLQQPLSLFSANSYVRRYGSWRQALEAFVAAANDVAPQDKVTATTSPTVFVVPSSPMKQRTPRDPTWKLRFLVNRRDRFTCRACGRSPASQLGVVLHVDHIKPWSKGGETTLENLQTLCQECNLGKSDLPMNEDEG